MIFFLLATSLKPDGSFAFTATVVVAGLFIVLLTLAAMIVIFSLFSYIVAFFEKRANKKKQNEIKETVPAPPEIKGVNELPPPPPIEDGVPPEIVAVISAAIYSLEGESSKITSIKRTPKRAQSPWAQAAVIENTKPF